MVRRTETPETITKRVAIISPPNFQHALFEVRGTVPYAQCRFSYKVQQQMLEYMEQEGQGKKRARPKRDRKREFKEAMYLSHEGKRGINAMSFRNAMISACRTVPGITMALAKLTVFIEADGYDKDDNTPLVYINGKPELSMGPVRLPNGAADIRTRASWKDWTANVHVRFDADQFSYSDIANLLMRAGKQVGIGEGRPDGRKANGLGWGLFDLELEQELLGKNVA